MNKDLYIWRLYEKYMVWRKTTIRLSAEAKGNWQNITRNLRSKIRPLENDWQGAGGFLFSWKTDMKQFDCFLLLFCTVLQSRKETERLLN